MQTEITNWHDSIDIFMEPRGALIPIKIKLKCGSVMVGKLATTEYGIYFYDSRKMIWCDFLEFNGKFVAWAIDEG